jgi:hypothetical protein
MNGGLGEGGVAKEEAKLTEGGLRWLNEHLDSVKVKIIEEAGKISKAPSEGKIEVMAVSDAAKKYAPGGPFELQNDSVWRRIFEPISGLTLVSAVLAVTFGWLGLRATGAMQQGWLDIAKIFAGAIVGSAGAAVASAMRGR